MLIINGLKYGAPLYAGLRVAIASCSMDIVGEAAANYFT